MTTATETRWTKQDSEDMTMDYPDEYELCLCGHTYADHSAGGGWCEGGWWSGRIEDDCVNCPCMGFREE